MADIVKTEASDVAGIKYIYSSDTSGTISIMEKINRLPDLHDPDLVPIELIQHLASNLGYDVGFNRDEIGTNIGNLYDAQSTTPEYSGMVKEKYLRFIVSNLPTWYRIKGTKNSFQSMLFTFGLIGNMYTYYTNDYDKNWKLAYSSNMTSGGNYEESGSLTAANIPDSYYPTSHCAIVVEIEDSVNASSLGIVGTKVLIAAEAIRPANVVFQGLIGHTTKSTVINISMNVRIRNTIVIS